MMLGIPLQFLLSKVHVTCGSPNNGGLDAGAVGCQGRLHLSCANAMAGDVDHIVHTPCDGVLTICRALAAVPSEIVPLCAPSLYSRPASLHTSCSHPLPPL